jgi:cytochrome c biogenesis protein CcdA
MENTVEKTWKPVTAGILNIVSGGLQALGALALIVIIIFIGSWNMADYMEPDDLPFVIPVLQLILGIVLVFAIITAVIPIIGGVYALQRRQWGWALAGSIISIFGNLALGVLATIFVSLAKEEFA